MIRYFFCLSFMQAKHTFENKVQIHNITPGPFIPMTDPIEYGNIEIH